MNPNVVQPDSLLSLSSGEALDRLVEIYCNTHGLDPEHIEWTLDSPNSIVKMKARDLTASGDEGLYIGNHHFTFVKEDVATLLPRPIFFMGKLKQSFSQLALDFKQMTGIHLDFGETVWSDGVRSYIPDNETTYCNLIPEETFDFKITITFTNQSIRFQPNSSFAVIVYDTAIPLTLKMLQGQLFENNSYENYRLELKTNFNNSFDLLTYSKLIPGNSPYASIDVSDNTFSLEVMTPAEAVIRNYYYSTGIWLDPQWLDLNFITHFNHDRTIVDLVPKAIQNNPYRTHLRYVYARFNRKDQSNVPTLFIPTMASMPFSYLKDVLWQRHRFKLDSGSYSFQKENENTLTLLEDGISLHLNNAVVKGFLITTNTTSNLKFIANKNVVRIVFV